MREVFRFVLRFDVPFQIVHLFLRPVTHDLTRQILTVVEIKVRRAHCLIRTVSTIVLEVANIGIADACVVIEASEFIIFALGWIGSRRHYGAIAIPDHFKIIEGDGSVRVFVGQRRYFDLNRD